MAHHVTTSIRLPDELRAQLEEAARAMHRGKSWIIIHALEAYLQTVQYNLLAAEARRQSLLTSKEDDPEEMQFWEDISDTAGWE